MKRYRALFLIGVPLAAAVIFLFFRAHSPGSRKVVGQRKSSANPADVPILCIPYHPSPSSPDETCDVKQVFVGKKSKIVLHGFGDYDWVQWSPDHSYIIALPWDERSSAKYSAGEWKKLAASSPEAVFRTYDSGNRSFGKSIPLQAKFAAEGVHY